jgi:hypothetical protein
MSFATRPCIALSFPFCTSRKDSPSNESGVPDRERQSYWCGYARSGDFYCRKNDEASVNAHMWERPGRRPAVSRDPCEGRTS